MSKTWKWILGITFGLVILFGVGFAAATFFGDNHMSFGRSAYNGHPMMDDYGFRDRNPMEGYNNYRHPMMSGYGFMPLPFLFFGGLLRLLFPLTILGAVGYFSYKKGKKGGMEKILAAPASIGETRDEAVEKPKQKASKTAEEN